MKSLKMTSRCKHSHSDTLKMNTKSLAPTTQPIAFVLPSLEDNLPNTIMEALACGVPCVGFKVGGIPEMIDHRQNGYVAEYRNATDLANGIYWTLFDADAEALSHAAIKKVNTSYSQQSVALKYIEVYNQAKAYKHYLK